MLSKQFKPPHKSYALETAALPGQNLARSAEASVGKEVIELKCELAVGIDPEPRKLYRVVLDGNVRERALIREALTSPSAVARNQDLLLPDVEPLLEGSASAQARYEKLRIIIPENLPPWAQEVWAAQANAPWRTYDLHGPEMSRFAQVVHDYVLPEFKVIFVPPVCAKDIDSEFECFAQRSSFLTFEIGRKLLKDLWGAVARSRISKLKLSQIADVEIRSGAPTLISPTPIGGFYRCAAQKELQLLLSAYLIEDGCLALNLPLGNQAKQTLLYYAMEKVGAERRVLLRLAAATKTSADAEDRISALCETRETLMAFLYPGRGARAAMLPSPVPQAPMHTVHVPPPAPRSTRLIIQAALETHGNTDNVQRLSRVLAKLAGDSPRELQAVLGAIEKGQDLETLITRLRQMRAPVTGKGTIASNLNERTAAGAREVPATPPLRAPQFHFSRKAREQLTDGALRHAVDQALERFVERPKLADLRKVRTVQGVWELRLLRENIRIYFCRLAAHQVGILFVRKKDTQDLDVPKLSAIRDEEKEHFQALQV
jgi:hypothetical protein